MNKSSDCKQFEELLGFDEDLPRDQRASLSRHLVDCGSCRKKTSDFRSIMSALGSNSADPHPARELLSRFAVERCRPGELDYDGRRLSSEEFARIESHLESCGACRELANLAIGEYREIDAYMEGLGLPEVLPRASRATLNERIAAFWRGLGSHTVVYASGAAMAILLLWVSPLFRPDAERYYALASLSQAESDSAVVVTRADAGELNDGLAAFSQGRYLDAIEPLSTYIEEDQQSANAAYARFVLGLSYLHVARSDFLGRRHRVDAQLVDRAIGQLAEAERTTDIVRVREDALWFLAKAHLLKLDVPAALEALDRVESINGRRASDASGLANAIRALGEASR